MCLGLVEGGVGLVLDFLGFTSTLTSGALVLIFMFGKTLKYYVQ